MPFDSSPRSFARREIRDDHDFASDQLLRVVSLRDAGHDLPNLGAQVDFQAQQFVGALHLLRDLHLADAQTRP